MPLPRSESTSGPLERQRTCESICPGRLMTYVWRASSAPQGCAVAETERTLRGSTRQTKGAPSSSEILAAHRGENSHAAITPAVPPRENPPLSLCYHGLADVRATTPGSGLFVRPRDLERQIRALRRWGYRLLTFGEQARLAVDGRAAGTASLTFDDGLADTHETLLPLLRRLDVTATVFVVTGWLGGHHPHASWARILSADELRALHMAGIEIGGHTVSHPDLTRLSPEQAESELAGSRRTLEELIEAPVTVAAYPFGSASPDTVAACRRAGYVAACRGPGGSWKKPFEHPREHMQYGGGLLGLRLKRRGRYEPLMDHLPAKAVRRAIRRGREAVRVVSGDRL